MARIKLSKDLWNSKAGSIIEVSDERAEWAEKKGYAIREKKEHLPTKSIKIEGKAEHRKTK